MTNDTIVTNTIENRIFTIRGQKVMIDRDLAELYGVELKKLNQAAKRNIERFQDDFMFQLTKDEWDSLRSQIVTTKRDNLRSQFATAKRDITKIRYLPYAFTEHGVLMLSNVLNSSKAINMSIQIIRVFDKLRKFALEQSTKDTRMEEIHRLLMLHIENSDYKFSEYDETIRQIIHALNNLLEKPAKTRRIGFNADG